MSIGYVTVIEADEYISTRYTPSSEDRIRWTALPDDDKEIYLQQSIDAIERLPFRGRKTYDSQVLAFPRYPLSTVPGNVKAAQVENALKLSDSDNSEDTELYDKLNLHGVYSYSIGNLSERLTAATTARTAGISSTRAMQFLQPFLMGGFDIL